MPKKNKAYRQNFGRRYVSQKSSASFLLVCEGQATEPQYFKFLKRKYNFMGVKIASKTGSSPTSIAEHAKNKAWEENHDYIYCIFDRDDHRDFDSALRMIKKLRQDLKQAGKDTKIEIIVSYPCFELWLLYHFKYTDKKAGDGKCTPVAKLLRKQKGFGNFYKSFDDNQLKMLYAKIDFAIKNAEKSVQRTKSLEEKNPSTHVHEVIKKLQTKAARW